MFYLLNRVSPDSIPDGYSRTVVDVNSIEFALGIIIGLMSGILITAFAWGMIHLFKSRSENADADTQDTESSGKAE